MGMCKLKKEQYSQQKSQLNSGSQQNLGISLRNNQKKEKQSNENVQIANDEGQQENVDQSEKKSKQFEIDKDKDKDKEIKNIENDQNGENGKDQERMKSQNKINIPMLDTNMVKVEQNEEMIKNQDLGLNKEKDQKRNDQQVEQFKQEDKQQQQNIEESKDSKNQMQAKDQMVNSIDEKSIKKKSESQIQNNNNNNESIEESSQKQENNGILQINQQQNLFISQSDIISYYNYDNTIKELLEDIIQLFYQKIIKENSLNQKVNQIQDNDINQEHDEYYQGINIQKLESKVKIIQEISEQQKERNEFQFNQMNQISEINYQTQTDNSQHVIQGNWYQVERRLNDYQEEVLGYFKCEYCDHNL